MKRLTDLAIQLSQLYRHGHTIGVKFETIADHLSLHVAVKGADLRYKYINLPGQVQHLLPSALSGQVSDADLLGPEVSQRITTDDRRALSTTAPLLLWSEPQKLPDGSTERTAQVKLGLHTEHGEALGVLDVAPITEPQAPASDTPSRPVALDEALTGRILYVEDNPSNVLLVSECLALRPGIELVTAANVQEGLRAITQDRFDLILLDLQLPDGDGYAVLKRLREQRGRPTPCVALTANAMLNERNRALEAGFDEFWTKPLNLPQFLLNLDRWLSKEVQL